MNTLRSFLLFLIIVFSNTTFGQEVAKLDIISIKSKFLSQEREILIYTPWLYEERDLVSFDVIYVFDSQHRELFDLVHSASNFIMGSKKFIVVGIQSPGYPEIDYYRNNDLFPMPINVPLEGYNVQNPNAENFWKYVNQEVFPLISETYRTTNKVYLIGHSMSASFVLDKLIKHPDLFTGVIAISPNLAYDENRLAQDFINTKFDEISDGKFIYISQANEYFSFGEKWVKAYEKVKEFIEHQNATEKHTVLLKEYPNENHWSVYLPSLSFAMNNFKEFVNNNPYIPNGNKKQITFKVRVLEENDNAYITGNQESLGNWDPSKVKLTKTSTLEREITLEVQFPLEFKITRGNWESQAFTNQTTNDGENIIIFNVDKEVSLKVEQWNDR
ncbi:alpha/beta hydrolase-fold protein [Psychroserpens sp. XS_ASV72]